MASKGKYTTIPVSQTTKRILEMEKGEMSWDEFLLLLVRIKRDIEAKKALSRIKKRLAKSEKFIRESVEDLRRGLRLEK